MDLTGKKMFKYKDTDLFFDKGGMNYQNGDLHLQLNCIDTEYDFAEPYATLTKALGYDSTHLLGASFIDENNLSNDFFDVNDFLFDNDLASRTGLGQQSGYCLYPLVIFNPEKMEEIFGEKKLLEYFDAFYNHKSNNPDKLLETIADDIADEYDIFAEDFKEFREVFKTEKDKSLDNPKIKALYDKAMSLWKDNYETAKEFQRVKDDIDEKFQRVKDSFEIDDR